MTKTYFIGTSGWDYPHWRGLFYPEDIKRREWFNHYSESFNTVEVNNTFYRWPTEKTLRKWKDNSPRGFKYTLKAPRTITHVRRLKNVQEKVKQFYRLTGLLKDRMGCHLFQLPPDMKRTPENADRLKDLLVSLDARKDNAVEFRHESWWHPDTYKLLREHKCMFCTVSGLGMPKEWLATSRKAYVRFHGKKYSTKYSENEVKLWGQKMKASKAKKVYAYFNNDAKAYAPKNAEMLREVLGDA